MAKASANCLTTGATLHPSCDMMELVCSVQTLPSLRAAIDHGADCIQIEAGPDCRAGLALRLGSDELARGIAHARFKGVKTSFALQVDSRRHGWMAGRELIDQALAAGADTLVLSDPGLMLYAAARQPEIQLHYAMDEGSLSIEALQCLRRQTGITRVVLPRVVSLAQIENIRKETGLEMQVIGFGRSSSVLSSLLSPEIAGSPAGRHAEVTLSNPINDRCAMAEHAANDHDFTQLAVAGTANLFILPRLQCAGIDAVRIDAHFHSNTQLGQVIQVWREALDSCQHDPEHFAIKHSWINRLDRAARACRMQ
ncbi:peptidase U32 family protein [Noviherbaspirillum galbum]|uniref:U32 family peptidase n=1 Tax=Noviherbaspirillum galbum TaxID=2709383 RepID=A0A6B3SLU7_9BURK|nr:U32 family peptidase [Noviherbaspirillum galbum]NEX61760.1 hypothetical protein [Noviherbaspirillum galbum]